MHEVDFAGKSYKISFYDGCFKNPDAVSETMAGVPIERFNLMHEIGHAIEVSELVIKYRAHLQANKEYNDAANEYNNATPSEQEKMKPKIDQLDKKAIKAEAAMNAATTRSITEFEKLIKGKDLLTEYSQTNSKEAFAEAFALYKVDPAGIIKANPGLAKWFKKYGYMVP